MAIDTIWDLDKREIEIFMKGAEIATTIDKSFSYATISDIYGMHLTTIRSWALEDIYDYQKGSKKLLYEFLHRYNPANTAIYMEKYKLYADNTKEFISELILADVSSLDKMEDSVVSWKQKILKSLLKINKDLFAIQVKLIKMTLDLEKRA